MKKLPKPPGLDITQLPESHREKDTEKSKLLLDARIFRERKQEELAIETYAQVAAIEEELMQECLQAGVLPQFFSHAFSAVICWGNAGNLYRAHQLCQMIVAHPEVTDAYRQETSAVLTSLSTAIQNYSFDARKAA
jgi:hypothetical protein